MRPADFLSATDAFGRSSIADLARLFSGAGFFAAGLVALAILRFLPVSTPDSLPVLCPFRLLTGHPCPGCGVIHCLSALAHGDPARAFHSHPFALVLALSAIPTFVVRKVLGPARRAGRMTQGPGPLPPRGTGLLFAGFCTCWAAWWVAGLAAF